MEQRKPKLIEESRCTACGACAQICSQGAIEMQSNENGFLYPKILESKCIRCGLCEKICPIGNPVECRNIVPEYVYASWHKDEKVRKVSSSGGVFSAIAEYVLNQGGLVWGAAYAENMRLTYQCVDCISDLDRLRRSKYIQSEVGDAFVQIKRQLQEGHWVLFVGTPCHVKGLYAYLGNREYDCLMTVDFVCHGVPSFTVFRKYLDWIEQKYQDKLYEFNFRDKRYGWDNGVLTVGIFNKIGERVFMKEENSFFYGMLHNLFLRSSCYDCESNGVARYSDFTIADFWGIGKNMKFDLQRDSRNGISMVALNSSKANRIYTCLDQLYKEQRPIREAYEGNWNYRYSSRKNPKTDKFWISFRDKEWKELLYFFEPTLLEKCKFLVKRYMSPNLAGKLKRIIGK